MSDAAAEAPVVTVRAPVTVTLCDLAGNCASDTSEPFLEVDQVPPAIVFEAPSSPAIFGIGQTVNLGVQLDREVGDAALTLQLGGATFIPTYEHYTGAAGTPYGYRYSLVLPGGFTEGSYAIALVAGTDAFGNQLASSAAPIVGPSLTLKSVPPVLTSSFPRGQTGYAFRDVVEAGIDAPQMYSFVSQSAGVVDDLSTGTLAVCLNPSLPTCVGATTSASSGGLTVSIKPRTNVKVGQIDLTVAAGATGGEQYVQAQFTDKAGNVGALQFKVIVDNSPKADDLTSTLEPYRVAGAMPAIAGAVFQGKKLLGIGSSGIRKVGDPTPVTNADEWHLGSDTKAMTATLMGIYIDRNIFHFENTIADMFAGETIDPGYRDVTVEDLMHHLGGAPANIPGDIWNDMYANPYDPAERMKAVRAILARPPEQPRGTYTYSNAGYMILGAAMERALGASWEQMLQSEIWNQLHMGSCVFGPPGTPGLVEEPCGHQTNADDSLSPWDPGAIPGDNPPSLGPANSAACSLTDWGKFAALHLAALRGEASTIISNATMQRLHTPYPGGEYAAGWQVVSRSWAGGTALTHTGSNTFWYVTIWMAPAKNLTFLVATNAASSQVGGNIDAAFGPLIDRYAP